MLELNSRHIIFYSLSLSPLPLNGPRPDLLTCLTALRAKYKKGELFQTSEDKSCCIRVADLRVDVKNNLAAFLFQYADKNVANPVFSDLETGQLRQESKLNGEGIAISSHALMSLVPASHNSNEYRFLLEDVPGIGKTKIERFLKHFLKALLTTTFKEPGTGKILQTYPSASLEAFASKTLRDDLEKGSLSFVELSRNITVSDLDELPETSKIVNTIRVKAKDKPQGQQAIGFINKIKNYGKIHRYDDVKVIFKKPDGKQKTVNFSSLREDAGDICFGKTERIEVDYDLEQCISEIDRKLLTKIKALL